MSAARGIQRERDLIKRLETQGWFAMRAPASKGAFDVLALRPGEAVMYEVKSTKAGPFHSFGPADRARLRETATRAGARFELVWWPADRQGPRFLPPDAWPS